MNNLDNAVGPQQAVAHITPAVWAKANRPFNGDLENFYD